MKLLVLFAGVFLVLNTCDARNSKPESKRALKHPTTDCKYLVDEGNLRLFGAELRPAKDVKECSKSCCLHGNLCTVFRFSLAKDCILYAYALPGNKTHPYTKIFRKVRTKQSEISSAGQDDDGSDSTSEEEDEDETKSGKKQKDRRKSRGRGNVDSGLDEDNTDGNGRERKQKRRGKGRGRGNVDAALDKEAQEEGCQESRHHDKRPKALRKASVSTAAGACPCGTGGFSHKCIFNETIDENNCQRFDKFDVCPSANKCTFSVTSQGLRFAGTDTKKGERKRFVVRCNPDLNPPSYELLGFYNTPHAQHVSYVECLKV